MKGLSIICIFITINSFAQITNEGKYNWEYVMKRIKESKTSTAGTMKVIVEISNMYSGESQQRELIDFHRTAYDYKIVDKDILKNLIDSLSVNGVTDEVKTLACQTQTSIEQRLLTTKVKDLIFPDKDGNLISLTSLNEKIVIIELWATWCGPCIREMPKIPVLRSANPNIEFYSISLDKTPRKMKNFVEKNKYEWPIVFGGDEVLNKELWNYFHIVAIPKYYIIDRKGIITHSADTLDETYIRNLK